MMEDKKKELELNNPSEETATREAAKNAQPETAKAEEKPEAAKTETIKEENRKPEEVKGEDAKSEETTKPEATKPEAENKETQETQEAQEPTSTKSEEAIKAAKEKYKEEKRNAEKENFWVRLQNLDAWKKKKLITWFIGYILVGVVYLTVTGSILVKDKLAEDTYWEQGMQDNDVVLAEAASYNENATYVTSGTYIENIREINVKSSYFRVVMNVWFRWEGDDELDMANNFRIYNGTINKKEIVDDVVDGTTHYQNVRVDATIQKDYWIVRFPLNSYQLRVFVEPVYTVDRVMFVADTENSTVNPYITVSGFDLTREGVSTYTYSYSNNQADPETQVPIKQELCTSMEVNRSGFGLYVKCFIALFGTITWIFITVFLCTFHRVDPLGMIPAALFGTVTNISVGASLLPDALEAGLLEFVNFGGIMIILGGAMTVVNVNRIRNKHQDADFAFIFGRTIFFTLLFFTVVAFFMYPLAAYRF